MRTVQRDEIARALGAAPPGHRPLLDTLVFCALRIGEALALRWSDADLDTGPIRVRWQIDAATGRRVEPKTKTAKREVVVMPALARMLAAHRVAPPHSCDDDPVFASRAGTRLLRSTSARGSCGRRSTQRDSADRTGPRCARTTCNTDSRRC